MAKANKLVESERDPAEPIGNPPGGGSWTWDIELQAWVEKSVAEVVEE